MIMIKTSLFPASKEKVFAILQRLDGQGAFMPTDRKDGSRS